MVNNVKKYFKIFQFLAKFLSRNANAHTDEKNFCCKIFCLLKKLDGANMTYDNVCVQKLIFSSKLKILLLKTNFFKHKPTHLILLPSNFSNKQKILQQNFFS